MLDIIKKLFSTDEDTDSIENIENAKEFKTEKDFFSYLFGIIEEACTQGKSIPCKIFFLREEEEEFLVKVKGLYSHLPLALMPWQYPDKAYWKLAASSLAGREFKCKITEAIRKEGDKPFYITVDASGLAFRPAPLVEEGEYTGIILSKTDDDLLIDAGTHFKWKYGSLRGYIQRSDFANPETFQNCEPGLSLKVKYQGKDEKGLIFKEIEAIDLVEEFVGKTVWVQICKSEDTGPYYMVKGKYKADLPVTKTHYPDKKKKLRKLRHQWKDGDIINCEVLEYNPKRGLIVKWIDDMPDEYNWTSYEMMDYIGRIVNVNVHLLDEEFEYLVENRFPCQLSPLGKNKKKYEPVDKDVILCRVCSIDLDNNCYKVRWIDQEKEPIATDPADESIEF